MRAQLQGIVLVCTQCNIWLQGGAKRRRQASRTAYVPEDEDDEFGSSMTEARMPRSQAEAPLVSDSTEEDSNDISETHFLENDNVGGIRVAKQSVGGAQTRQRGVQYMYQCLCLMLRVPLHTWHVTEALTTSFASAEGQFFAPKKLAYAPMLLVTPCLRASRNVQSQATLCCTCVADFLLTWAAKDT